MQTLLENHCGFVALSGGVPWSGGVGIAAGAGKAGDGFDAHCTQIHYRLFGPGSWGGYGVVDSVHPGGGA